MQKIAISQKLQQKLKTLTPWVFRHELAHNLPDGTLVQLIDHKNKPIGFGLADSGDISIRVLGRTPRQLDKIIEQRIEQAFSMRSRFGPPDTTCFRLINGEGDGLSGIIADVYADTVVLRLYAKCWEPHLQLLVNILSSLPNIERVYRKYGVRNVDGKKAAKPYLGLHCPNSY